MLTWKPPNGLGGQDGVPRCGFPGGGGRGGECLGGGEVSLFRVDALLWGCCAVTLVSYLVTYTQGITWASSRLAD